ncbi:MAG: hypothetical protein ACI89G_001499 [Minisyncoccia bacterium]|jgi:hypothetical protein|tara:strand:- start:1563 stop:2282 length:720 start_codon:yes stop_codon:yes gene_type:complete
MSNGDAAVGGGAGATRRNPRQGVGGSPVGSTLSIVLAVVAVIAGFLILRNLTQEDSSVARSGDPSGQTAGVDATTTTTIDVGVTTSSEAPATTVPPAFVTEGAVVVVANGNTFGGSAGRMSEALGTTGYNMGTPVNAQQTIDESIVYFDPTNPSAQAVAESVGRTLGDISVLTVSNPAPTENGSLDEAGVLVVLGNNQADKTLLQLAEAAESSTELGSAPAVAGDVVAPTIPPTDETGE